MASFGVYFIDLELAIFARVIDFNIFERVVRSFFIFNIE